MNGSPVGSGQYSAAIDLDEGDNDIEVIGLAEDGVTSKIYTVTVSRQEASAFVQEAYIKSSNPTKISAFGYRVELSGNTLAVGVPKEGVQSTKAGYGGVYLFRRDSSDVWSQQAYIKPSNRGGYFGASVALSDSLLVAGAPSEDGSSSGINGDDDVSGNSRYWDYGAVYVILTE